MDKILKEGGLLGYVITGFIVFSFWGYYILDNPDIRKFISKFKGSKIKW